MKSNLRIALLGGSFNPPGTHHSAIVECLKKQFDSVIVIPCGERPDKPSTREVEAEHRRNLATLAFGAINGVEIDLCDLRTGTFSRTHALEERYSRAGEVWHAVGADIVAGGGRQESQIHKVWEKGPELWNSLNFVILPRPGFTLLPEDLPPKSVTLDFELPASSSEIKELIRSGGDWQSLVQPQVADYIKNNQLYR